MEWIDVCVYIVQFPMNLTVFGASIKRFYHILWSNQAFFCTFPATDLLAFGVFTRYFFLFFFFFLERNRSNAIAWIYYFKYNNKFFPVYTIFVDVEI